MAIQRTNKKIKHYDPIIKKIEDYKRKKIEISKKISVIIDLDRYRLAPVVILSDLNQQKPEKLWFTNLQESGKNLTISGIAVDNETIVTFLNNLKNSAPLKKADLVLLRSKKMNNLELKEFTIQCPLELKTLPDTLKTPENIQDAKPKENQNG
ncbi:MAG: PilN domain-containing protein [Deltaproteobacteria bacterium]|nr:PilN domain-containing protein [Candidatus Tharpella aukensis]